jgi:hypothetical protein
MTATSSSNGSSTSRRRHCSSWVRRCGPQLRTAVHLVSSPRVTNVMHAVWLARLARRRPGRVPRKAVRLRRCPGRRSSRHFRSARGVQVGQEGRVLLVVHKARYYQIVSRSERLDALPAGKFLDRDMLGRSGPVRQIRTCRGRPAVIRSTGRAGRRTIPRHRPAGPASTDRRSTARAAA